jgi:hypothetical protein
MQATDLTTTITVDQTPQEVFEAVITPQSWWSGDFEGNTKNVNDEFTYRYQDMHYSKQRVIESIPGKKVVWQVTESQLNFIEDKEEWTGTKIVFEISEKDGKTELRFTHVGLNPEVECYSDCSVAWTRLIQQSLYTYITTGKVEKPML